MSDAASDQPSVRGDPSMIPAALSVTSVIAAVGEAPPDAPHAPVGPTIPTARMLSEMPLYDVPQQQAAPVAPTSEFKEGDVVLLKKGGSLMTIGTMRPDNSMDCIWFERRTAPGATGWDLHEETFSRDSLVLATPQQIAAAGGSLVSPPEPLDVTPAPVGVDPAPQPTTRPERVAWLQNHVADLEGEVRRAVQELEKLHGGAENPHPHTFVAIRNALSHLVDLARKLKP